MTKKSLVRVNTRIGHNQNDWLDAESAKTGISKSSLIQLAIESYMQQKESVDVMKMMAEKIDLLDDIVKKAQE